MNNNRNLITWGIILLILVGTGLLTIAWPVISGLLTGESASMGVTGPETVVIPLPIPINEQTEVAVQSWQLFGILAFLIIGAVITAGIGITIINYFFSRFVTNTENDPEFQKEWAELEQHEKEELKAEQATRPDAHHPGQHMGSLGEGHNTFGGIDVRRFLWFAHCQSAFPGRVRYSR